MLLVVEDDGGFRMSVCRLNVVDDWIHTQCKDALLSFRERKLSLSHPVFNAVHVAVQIQFPHNKYCDNTQVKTPENEFGTKHSTGRGPYLLNKETQQLYIHSLWTVATLQIIITYTQNHKANVNCVSLINY